MDENEEVSTMTPGGSGRPMERTYQQKLSDKKAALEAELQDTNNALKLLEENPKVLEVLNALAKVQRRL